MLTWSTTIVVLRRLRVIGNTPKIEDLFFKIKCSAYLCLNSGMFFFSINKKNHSCPYTFTKSTNRLFKFSKQIRNIIHFMNNSKYMSMTFLLNSQKRRHLFRLSQSAVPCWGIWCKGFVWWGGTIGSGQSESSGDRQSRPLHPAYSCHTRIQGEEKIN